MNEIETLLKTYPKNIASLAWEVCELIAKHAVGSEKRVKLGWKVIIFEYENGFCAVAPQKNWVNLQFHSGTDLPDPLHLLEGTGKSMRHVKIRSADDLDVGVIALVKAAAGLAQSERN